MGCGSSSGGEIKIPEKAMSSFNLEQQKTLRFIRKEAIGKGTYGQVYRCIQTSTNTQYAMKVIKINSKTSQQAKKQIELLKNQIGVLKKISHPHIVKYYSFDITPDLQEVQIVLELVKSGTLKEYLDKNGPMSQSLTAQISRKILQALIYLHQMKLIHRDLKCANILLTEDFIPKLTDFGTAKIIVDKNQDDIAKMSASLKGTPYYMAPQVLKRTGHNYSADIWSFGCMVIEMLSGKAPWTGISSNFSEIINYISSSIHPPFPPNISRQCTFFLQSCLDPIPSKRLKANQLIKHRFIERNTLNQRKQSQERGSPSQLKSRKSIINNIQGISLGIQNLQSPQIGFKSREQFKKQFTLTQIETGKQSNRNQGISKRSSVYRNKSSAKKSTKVPIKKTEKYTKQIQRLEKLQDQISEVSISQEQIPKDYYIVKKALLNLKQKKKGISKTSTSIKNAEENLLSMSNSQNISSNDLQLRSNTEMTHQEEIINTAISKAERDQYIEQQKNIQKQRRDEQKKWQEELKQGAAMLKKEFSNRYMYAGR